VLLAAQKLIGPNHAGFLQEPVMVSEDFSLFLEKVPGCMFFLGTGSQTAGEPGLHSAFFRVNETILPLGAGILAQIVLDFQSWSQ
jgi:hippurate hydrolase